MVKCEVLNDIEQRATCNKDSEGSHFFYFLPNIIIVTVVIVIATIIIGFAVKSLVKHLHEHDNDVHHLDDSLLSPRWLLLLTGFPYGGLRYFPSGSAATTDPLQPLLERPSSLRRENRDDRTAGR